MDIALNERDLEVLSLVADGMTSNEIANALHLSSHTVRSRKKQIIKKLSAANMIEAVYKATPAIIAWREEEST
jgi:DNA-binding NarL/FixJ family response regulator